MKVKILFTSTLSVALAACGGGASSSSEPPTSTTVEPPVSKVLVNYKAAALPLMVGSYSGTECVKVTGGVGGAELGPATVKVGADGMVETTGVSDSLLQATVAMNLSRELGPAGPIGAMYVISEPSDSRGLVVTLSETLSSSGVASTGAFVINNALGVSCPAPETANLKTKSIYTAFAKFIESPKRTAKCARTDGTAMAALNVVYQVHDGEVKFDDQVYSLSTGLKSESLVVPADGGMVYSSQSLDGKTLSLSLDKFGNPESAVATAAKPAFSYSCDLKPKG